MKTLISTLAITLALAFTGPAFAGEVTKATDKASCDKAGGTWLWPSVIVILIGAELNAEIEHQTARDTTIGQEKPLGMRGAVMADTLGEAWG
jgi:hypothetical protein